MSDWFLELHGERIHINKKMSNTGLAECLGLGDAGRSVLPESKQYTAKVQSNVQCPEHSIASPEYSYSPCPCYTRFLTIGC